MTATIAHSTKLAPVFNNIYRSLLDQSQAREPGFLLKLAEYLKKFNLLTVRQESLFKPREISVDLDQLNDSKYRRRLIRQLKAPRPSPFVYHTLPLDNERLSNEAYFDAIVDFLTQATCERLSDARLDQVLILAQLKDEVLFDFLKQRSLFELTAEHLSQFALNRICMRAIEDNPRFQAACASIREAGQQARAQFVAEMELVSSAQRADFAARMAVITDEVGRQCDLYIGELHQRAAERQAADDAAQAIVDAEAARNFGKSEQQIFAEKVKLGEQEYRRNNPMHPLLKGIYWAGALALAAGAISMIF